MFPEKQEKCTPIQHELCNDLPYNLTSFPNMAGEENWKDAAETISTYKPLLSVVCSEQLKFFLCSVYFPMCNEKLLNPIGPCRPLCLSVKEKCLPILEGFGLSWPQQIRCEQFPLENNNEKMCMKGPNEQGAIQSVAHENSLTAMPKSQADCNPKHVYMNRTGRCVPLCSHGAQTGRNVATTVLMVLSVACLVLTVVTVLMMLVTKTTASSLPETAMLWAAVSFAISSVTCIASLLYRNQIACTDYSQHVLFVVEGLSHVPCSAAGSILYYFGTAGRLWWLVICCTWNESTHRAMKMEKHAVQVRMLVWGVPLAPVMLSLITRSISADPLTGICFVGASSKLSDFMFNAVREVSLSVSCLIPLFLGCVAVLGSTAERGVNSMAGLAGLFYPIAALFYLLSYINDAVQPRAQWSRTWNLVSAIKFTFDFGLGLVVAAMLLLHVITTFMRSSRASARKEGYQPAVPNIPQPAIPGSVRSNTYASTFRAPNLI